MGKVLEWNVVRKQEEKRASARNGDDNETLAAAVFTATGRGGHVQSAWHIRHTPFPRACSSMSFYTDGFASARGIAVGELHPAMDERTLL